MDRKPTLRDSQRAFAMYAPFDGAAQEPSWMAKKPRSDTGVKRGRQEETTWLHKLIRPFRGFVRLAWPAGSVWLARNNCGAWKLPDGRYVTYGLGKGTGDAIGFKSIVVTPDMVGKRLAVFVTLEAKRDGEELQAIQQCFHDAVEAAGGIALKASPECEREVLGVLG